MTSRRNSFQKIGNILGIIFICKRLLYSTHETTASTIVLCTCHKKESFLFRLGWCLQIIDIYFLATVWIQAVLSCTLARLTNLPIFIAFRNKFPYPDATSWVPPAVAMLELYYRYTAKGKRIAFYSLVIVPSFFLCCTLLAAAQLFIEVLITKERKSRPQNPVRLFILTIFTSTRHLFVFSA